MPWTRYWFELARMGWEAQAVIGLRMMGMVGVLPAAPSENRRMYAEKADAFWDAQWAMWRAAMRGGSPEAVAAAGLAPVGRRTRANAKRLGRAAVRGRS